MKRFFLMLLCAVFLMSGCSMDNVKREITDEAKEFKQDIKEDTQEIKEDLKQTMQQKPDETKFIGEDKAKEIALKKAELTASDVIFDRVELDNDNGVWQYEVEFKKGQTEYQADIDATSGEIISWEIDND